MTAQDVIDLIREKVAAAYDENELDLGARMTIDDILDEVEAGL